MPWEDIGSVGSGELPEDREWIGFCLALAKGYIVLTAGIPPEHCDIGIVEHDHEQNCYPSLALCTEEYGIDLDTDYVVACQNALSAFDDAIDWKKLRGHWEVARDSRNEHYQDAGDVDDDRGGQFNISASI